MGLPPSRPAICCAKRSRPDRRLHRETGRIYNVNPDGAPQPPADMRPEELIQRADDKPEAIDNRLEFYRRQTQPLIASYRERRLLVDI